MMSSTNIKLGIALLLAMLLAACGGSTSPRESPAAASANRRPPASAAADPSQTMSVDGGNVTVSVTPRVLKRGLPLEFEIGMNTHSVDLSADMSKAVVLRTAPGVELEPTRWAGPGPGGHHREGIVVFAPLTTTSQTVTLVVKDVGGVPERLFMWNFAE